MDNQLFDSVIIIPKNNDEFSNKYSESLFKQGNDKQPDASGNLYIEINSISEDNRISLNGIKFNLDSDIYEPGKNGKYYVTSRNNYNFGILSRFSGGDPFSNRSFDGEKVSYNGTKYNNDIASRSYEERNLNTLDEYMEMEQIKDFIARKTFGDDYKQNPKSVEQKLSMLNYLNMEEDFNDYLQQISLIYNKYIQNYIDVFGEKEIETTNYKENRATYILQNLKFLEEVKIAKESFEMKMDERMVNNTNKGSRDLNKAKEDSLDLYFSQFDELIKDNEYFDNLVFDRKNFPRKISIDLKKTHLKRTREIRDEFNSIKAEYDAITPIKNKIMAGTASKQEIEDYGKQLTEISAKLGNTISFFYSSDSRANDMSIKTNLDKIKTIMDVKVNSINPNDRQKANNLIDYYNGYSSRVGSLKRNFDSFLTSFNANEYIQSISEKNKEEKLLDEKVKFLAQNKDRYDENILTLLDSPLVNQSNSKEEFGVNVKTAYNALTNYQSIIQTLHSQSGTVDFLRHIDDNSKRVLTSVLNQNNEKHNDLVFNTKEELFAKVNDFYKRYEKSITESNIDMNNVKTLDSQYKDRELIKTFYSIIKPKEDFKTNENYKTIEKMYKNFEKKDEEYTISTLKDVLTSDVFSKKNIFSQETIDKINGMTNIEGYNNIYNDLLSDINKNKSADTRDLESIILLLKPDELNMGTLMGVVNTKHSTLGFDPKVIQDKYFEINQDIEKITKKINEEFLNDKSLKDETSHALSSNANLEIDRKNESSSFLGMVDFQKAAQTIDTEFVKYLEKNPSSFEKFEKIFMDNDCLKKFVPSEVASFIQQEKQGNVNASYDTRYFYSFLQLRQSLVNVIDENNEHLNDLSDLEKKSINRALLFLDKEILSYEHYENNTSYNYSMDYKMAESIETFKSVVDKLQENYKKDLEKDTKDKKEEIVNMDLTDEAKASYLDKYLEKQFPKIDSIEDENQRISKKAEEFDKIMVSKKFGFTNSKNSKFVDSVYSDEVYKKHQSIWNEELSKVSKELHAIQARHEQKIYVNDEVSMALDESIKKLENIGMNEKELAAIGTCYTSVGGIDSFRKLILESDKAILDDLDVDSTFVKNYNLASEEDKEKILSIINNNNLDGLNDSEIKVIKDFLADKSLEQKQEILKVFEEINTYLDRDLAEIPNATKKEIIDTTFITSKRINLTNNYVDSRIIEYNSEDTIKSVKIGDNEINLYVESSSNSVSPERILKAIETINKIDLDNENPEDVKKSLLKILGVDELSETKQQEILLNFKEAIATGDKIDIEINENIFEAYKKAMTTYGENERVVELLGANGKLVNVSAEALNNSEDSIKQQYLNEIKKDYSEVLNMDVSKLRQVLDDVVDSRKTNENVNIRRFCTINKKNHENANYTNIEKELNDANQAIDLDVVKQATNEQQLDNSNENQVQNSNETKENEIENEPKENEELENENNNDNGREL